MIRLLVPLINPMKLETQNFIKGEKLTVKRAADKK